MAALALPVKKCGGQLIALALILPAVVLVFAPPLTMLVLSFCKGRFPSLPWLGWSLQWYGELGRNGALHASLLRSAAVGFFAAALSGVLGFLGGYWLTHLPERKAIRWLMVLTVPALVPFILFGISFLQFARLLGFSRTLFAVVLAHTAIFSPVALALCYHRCRQLSVDLEQAAREFGASETRILLQVVGLQMWRTVVAGMSVVFVLSWDEYIVSWFVSGFDKTYPVHVRNMLESTMSPEIDAAGVTVAFGSCLVVGIAALLLRRG